MYECTIHFKRNTCTCAHLCRYPISQSCGSCTVQKIMQIQSKLQSLFTPNIETRTKCDLCDINRDTVVRDRGVGLGISEIADLLGFSPTTDSRIYTIIGWVDNCVNEQVHWRSYLSGQWGSLGIFWKDTSSGFFHSLLYGAQTEGYSDDVKLSKDQGDYNSKTSFIMHPWYSYSLKCNVL